MLADWGSLQDLLPQGLGPSTSNLAQSQRGPSSAK